VKRQVIVAVSNRYLGYCRSCFCFLCCCCCCCRRHRHRHRRHTVILKFCTLVSANLCNDETQILESNPKINILSL